MDDCINAVREIWDTIGDSGQYMALAMLAIVVLLLKKTRNGSVLIKYTLLSWLIIFNPIVFFVCNRFGADYTTYWKLSLALMPIVICAYCATEIIVIQEKRKEKLISILMLVALVVIAGSLKNENIKSEYDTFDMEVVDEAISLLEFVDCESRVVLLANDNIMEVARAYNDNICFPYSVLNLKRQSDLMHSEKDGSLITLHEQIQDPTYYLGNITRVARAHQCNYIVLPHEADERSAMEHGGYVALGETDNYVIYFDTLLGKE